MSSEKQRIEDLGSYISKLLAISSCPGLSLGVIHHGEVIHTAHFGVRDVEARVAPNDDTIYRIWSLGKLLTIAAVGSLVEEGLLDWDMPIKHYLPEFGKRNDVVGQQATLVDALSNRTGLAISNTLWGQQYGTFLLPKNEIIPTCRYIEAVRPFHKSWVYSNWNYGLITEVIENVTGKNFNCVVAERLLQPMQMSRTTFGDPENDNVASAHAIRNDGSPCKTRWANYSSKTGVAGGGAGKSTIADMLKLYRLALSAYFYRQHANNAKNPKLPFKGIDRIFEPHIGLDGSAPSFDNPQSYCLGMYRTQLPGRLGIGSINAWYLGQKQVPINGTKSPGVEVFHHTGYMPGGLASAFLLPASQSAVVVLTNSMGLMDPTDFVGQLILSVLLGEENSIDFITLARTARQASLAAYPRLAASLAKRKTGKPCRFSLSAYSGNYWNAARNFILSVTAMPDHLLMTVQGYAFVNYRLLPFDGDTFYWPANREEELCNRHMFPFLHVGWYTIHFAANENGVVNQLFWAHDPMAKAEMFEKVDLTQVTPRPLL